MDITTKHTKSTKEENIFFRIRYPLRYPIFVSFAPFVVRKPFVKWRITDNCPPGQFAQAAQIFIYSSA